MEAIRSMTIEEIIEHLGRLSGALRRGFAECDRVINEHPGNHMVLEQMKGYQDLLVFMVGYLYDTFGIGPGVAGRLGDGIAENGTRGKGRRPFKWVSRAKLAEYWRCPAAGVSKKDIEALEADFASACALRLSERAVAMKLNGPIIEHAENGTRKVKRKETTMETWCIVWSQTFPETGTVRHVDTVDAINAAQALAQWGRKCFCNARVEAVWRKDFAGDGIAENGTRGMGRLRVKGGV